MVRIHPGVVHSYFFVINLSKENYAIPHAESDYFYTKAFASHKHFISVSLSEFHHQYISNQKKKYWCMYDAMCFFCSVNDVFHNYTWRKKSNWELSLDGFEPSIPRLKAGCVNQLRYKNMSKYYEQVFWAKWNRWEKFFLSLPLHVSKSHYNTTQVTQSSLWFLSDNVGFYDKSRRIMPRT
jgi:hypothetical protein